MNAETTDCSQLERDILEWNVPEEVLAVLLKDRTTGHNLIWATDDYAERGDGFAAAKMGPEIIPGLLASIRKATTERREYGKGKPSKSRG